MKPRLFSLLPAAAREPAVLVAALVALELAALTRLALHPPMTTTALVVGFAVAFGAYVAAISIIRRTSSPLWLWFAIALALRLPWLPSAPTLSDDVWRYLHDGRAQLVGVNPYRYAPDAPEAALYAGPEHELINHPELRTVYPPGAQLTFRIAVTLGGTVLAWKLVLLLFDLGVGGALVWLLHLKRKPPGLAVVYLLHPLPVIEFSGNGHVDAVGLATLVLALACLERRPILSGLSFAYSIASKYLAFPLLPFAARQLSPRRAVWLVAATVITLAALYAPFLGVNPIGSLGTFARTFEFNGSLYAVLAVFTSPLTARWLGLAVLLAVLAVLWRRRAPTSTVAFWWIAAVLLVSPIVHPWYVTWLIPFLALRQASWALAWSGTVILSYAVLPAWWASGVWALPAWVPWLEYIPVWGLLGVELVRHLKQGPRRLAS